MRTTKPNMPHVIQSKFDPILNPEQIQEGDRVRSTKEYRKQDYANKNHFTGTVVFVMGTFREVYLTILLDTPMPHRPDDKQISCVDARWVKKRNIQPKLFPFQKGRRSGYGD